MEAAVAAYPFDYIIGGIHFLGSWGFDFTQDDWKISPQQCYTRYENYFRTLADMARSGLVDAAHPDIKLARCGRIPSMDCHAGEPCPDHEALTAIRDNGLVMEISQPLRKPSRNLPPGDHEAGFELGVKISFGSDAHVRTRPPTHSRSAGSLCPFLRLHVQRHF